MAAGIVSLLAVKWSQPSFELGLYAGLIGCIFPSPAESLVKGMICHAMSMCESSVDGLMC